MDLNKGVAHSLDEQDKHVMEKNTFHSSFLSNVLPLIKAAPVQL